MSRLERIAIALFVALVAMLPFELQTFPILSSLQWLFLAIVLTSLPLVFSNRRKLFADRRVIAAVVFVLVECLAALVATDFRTNAAKGAIRAGAGLSLLCATLTLHPRKKIMQVWCLAAAAAAVYGIADYGGFGFSAFFRNAEFYVGDVLRLSGSFEYPNTAAVYFAMSLPIVWLTPERLLTRLSLSGLVVIALILTYSRGAAAAAALMLAAWAVGTKSRSALWLLSVAVALYAVLALIQPFLVQRLRESHPDKALAAEYHPEFNLMRHRPKESDQLKVSLKNTGAATWRSGGENPVTLSYHWYDTEHKRLAVVAAQETSIPGNVRTGDSVSVNASFYTPHEPGLYLLIWDLAQKGRGWFSASGVVPAVVETDIRSGNDVWHGNGDVSHWYHPDKAPTADAAIARTSLWRAAIRLARKHPILGSGPDNFRLLYGRELGLTNWDTNVRSNNLYLELLVGSGIAGLLAFVVMMASVPRRMNPAALALGVFLLHGIVDVFLMTTPIYFGFWILMGCTDEEQI